MDSADRASDSTGWHVGFFVIPPGSVEELTALHEKWAKALRQLRDDDQLLRNELYRRATEVALHHVELDGQDMFYALPEALSFLRPKLVSRRDQAVFSSGDCRVLAERIDKYVRRVGESRLLARLAKRDRKVPKEALHAVYSAFRAVLREAMRRDAGFLYAVRDDLAEAKLEEQRRADEEARNKPSGQWPLTPEEDRAQLQAWIDEGERIHMTSMLENELDLTVVWLVVMPESHVGAVRPVFEEAMDLRAKGGHRHQAAKMEERIREPLVDVALSVEKLRRLGEVRALEAMGAILGEVAPDVYRRAGVYDSAESRALLDAVRSWEDGMGGEQAAIADLAERSYINERLVTGAYRALKTAVQAATDREAGLVWTFDRLTAQIAHTDASLGVTPEPKP